MKRVYIFAGHYGSGKTNIAVNFALELRKTGRQVTIADLDIVNPYFRTKDSAAELEGAGVRLISSAFANSNADLPALPAEIYSVVDDTSGFAVLDVGGDDRGAVALGRYTEKIIAENSFECFLVINRFRPLTQDAQSVAAVRAEIERAGGVPFTGIINNSNLGEQTTAQDVLDSAGYAAEVSRALKLPVMYTAAKKELIPELSGKIENLLALELQKKII